MQQVSPQVSANGPVLHVVAPAHVGGLESVVRALLVGAAGKGRPGAVAALLQSTEPHPWLDQLRQDGVRVHEVRCGRRQYRAEARELADHARATGARLLHTHGYHADIVGLLAARRSGLPVVSTVHGFTGGGWRNLVYESLQCLAYQRFDAVVAVSASVAQRLRRRLVPRSRTHVIHNAWWPAGEPMSRDAARAALGVERGSTLVGWVGRMSHEKGPDVMIAAFERVNGAELSMIGDGPLRVALESAGPARVRWHGSLGDAGRLMPAFDVFALSSRTEGVPIVLFEAIGAGVPVVATRVGGVPEVVGEKEALLVEPESPDQLAAAIQRALADPAASAARVAAAKGRVASAFSADAWLERYRALYDITLQRAASGRSGNGSEAG